MAIATPSHCPRRTNWRVSSARWPQPGDAVICLGAGSITQWADTLPDELAGARQSLTRLTSFPDLVEEVKARAPRLRGRLLANAPIAETTWFRVGGLAEALFSPADEDDLADVLAALPRETPVTTIGLGSNLIVRDGGVAGVVVRLGGRAFGAVEMMDGCRLIAGAAAPDQYVAKAAARAGVNGLAFLRGVPGSISAGRS